MGLAKQKIICNGLYSMKSLRIVFLTLFTLSSSNLIQAQDALLGFYSVYSDSFREWIVPFDEEGEGEIRLKWPLKNDWTQWEISIGEYYGNVKQRWSNQADQWEAKINGQIIDIKTIYPRDRRSWRFKMNGQTADFKMIYNNSVENWSLEINEQNYFEIYTVNLGDLRVWQIEDQLQSIPIEMKIAAMVLCIYQSCPKI